MDVIKFIYIILNEHKITKGEKPEMVTARNYFNSVTKELITFDPVKRIFFSYSMKLEFFFLLVKR